MIKQNPNPLAGQKTALKQAGGKPFLSVYLFAVLVLLFASYPSFSQKVDKCSLSKNTVQSLNSHNVKHGDSCILCSLHLPSIAFSGTNTKLSKHAKVLLDSVIVLLKTHRCCNIKVSGSEEQYCFPRGRKSKSMLLWDRITFAIKYLVKNGISEDRIIFSFMGNDPKKLDLIDLEFTKEVKTALPVSAPNFSRP
jgi:hypothetical protein